MLNLSFKSWLSLHLQSSLSYINQNWWIFLHILWRSFIWICDFNITKNITILVWFWWMAKGIWVLNVSFWKFDVLKAMKMQFWYYQLLTPYLILILLQILANHVKPNDMRNYYSIIVHKAFIGTHSLALLHKNLLQHYRKLFNKNGNTS